jgi:hypothetical protein
VREAAPPHTITVKDLIARRDRPSDRGRPRAQGARSALVFGCASTGDARRLPAAEIHDEGEHDDDRCDQGYDERFVSPFPAGEAGGRQRRPTRKLTNTAAAKYRTCCWSRAPVDVVTMIRKAGPRDGSSTEVRHRLLLGLLEVGVGAGGVVGDVDDAVDLGDGLGDRHFDALAEGDCGHAAALASPAEA